MEADLVVDLLHKFIDVAPQIGKAGITTGIDLLPLERLDEALALAVGQVRQLQRIATAPTVLLRSSIRIIR